MNSEMLLCVWNKRLGPIHCHLGTQGLAIQVLIGLVKTIDLLRSVLARAVLLRPAQHFEDLVFGSFLLQLEPDL